MSQYQTEALNRARSGNSIRNEMLVLQAMLLKGVPREDIKPRDNCLTLQAWNALGRYVRKGEHGVRVPTIVSGTATTRDETTGQETQRAFKRMKAAYVFHISQTEARSRT